MLQGTIEDKRAEKYRKCADWLSFEEVEQSDGTKKLKLRNAMFCRDPYCPVCIPARSDARRRQVTKAMPLMIADHPQVKYLMMTLTVKNCEITNLRKTIKWMNSAFIKMINRDSFCELGYIRALEVTRDKNNPKLAHPHFHALLAVPPDYFSTKKSLYMSQGKLSELWKDALGINYTPIVDIRRIKVFEPKALSNAIGEIVKYVTKPTDLLEDVEWTCEYISQMLGAKKVTTGGLFRDYLKQIEQEPEDLIGKDDEDDRKTGIFVYFKYDYKTRNYVVLNSFEEILQNGEFTTQKEYSTSVL
jgi:plasmid rolling circle replication initiator protein Rep